MFSTALGGILVKHHLVVWPRILISFSLSSGAFMPSLRQKINGIIQDVSDRSPHPNPHDTKHSVISRFVRNDWVLSNLFGSMSDGVGTARSRVRDWMRRVRLRIFTADCGSAWIWINLINLRWVFSSLVMRRVPRAQTFAQGLHAIWI